MSPPTLHPVIQRAFVVEHTYRASPQRVYHACAQQDLKRRWMGGEGEGWVVTHHRLDFREGGREDWAFSFGAGQSMTNHTVFLDVVPDRRIVSAYTMEMGATRLSASLASMEFVPLHDAQGAVCGTRVIYSEQVTFLTGEDGVDDRAGGCAALLKKLDEVVQALA